MPALDNEMEQETQDLDTTAALAEISSDLFGQGSDDATGEKGLEGEGSKSSEAETPGDDAAKTSPQTPEKASETEENSKEVQDTGAPKTWTKEALAEWSTVPPRVQQEILKREEDFLKGITQYKAGAELGQRYDAVVQPFRPMFEADGIDPVQLFQSFSANHYLLSRGTPQQKLELAANLISGYGIDFASLINYVGDKALTPADPEISALRAEVAALKGESTQRQQAKLAEQTASITSEIEAAAADHENFPYFNQLVGDIIQQFERGLATNLKDAYEKAVYANPETRKLEIDRLTAKKISESQAQEQARRDKIARSTAADVTTSQTPRNGTVPVGSMDDTLAETLAAIRAKG